MYSQKHEDDIIKKLIPKNNGYFVDIGACDAKWISNSRYFAEIGWKILMLEMNPFNLCNLLKEYQGNSNIEIMSTAILEDTQEKIVKGYLTEGDAISTLFPHWKEKWEKKNAVYKYNNFSVNGITCTDLAKYIKTKTDTVDVVSIDVEGNSHKIGMNMVDVLDAKCYIVEHDDKIQELRQKFESLNYTYITHTTVNIIFVKK